MASLWDMTAQRALFIGGTGVISTACVRRAVEQGFEVSVLNRGATSSRPIPPEVRVLAADVRDPQAVSDALGDSEFDVVADFMAFTPDHIQADIDRFAGRIGQFVFISSASAYQTPPARMPVLESTPLRNPFWQYSRDKIACEDLLVAAYRDDAFPVTIVRPSHTYDHTLVPFDGGWTAIARMRRGAPVVVHGDGASLWTLTHHTDFARAFVGLLGNPRVVGDTFHITSDEALPWDQIARLMAEAAGVEPTIVHVPSDAVAALDLEWGAGLLGDKAHSMVFDNTKIKSAVPGWVATVPFAQGAREIVEWHDADPGRQVVEPELDAVMDRLVAAYAVGS
jgi:nucleoside-diphosphate-sugar epimerase